MFHSLSKFAGSATVSAQVPGHPEVLQTSSSPAQDPHRDILIVSVWSTILSSISHESEPHCATGAPHELGFGFLLVISAGMLAREKCQIFMPSALMRWAYTPPPALLNPSPQPLPEPSSKAQLICSVVPVVHFDSSVILPVADPWEESGNVHWALPARRNVRKLDERRLTDSMTSSSPELG